MHYDRNVGSTKHVRRNIDYTEGQAKALKHLKTVTGVPVSVAIRLALDEYLEKRMPRIVTGDANVKRP